MMKFKRNYPLGIGLIIYAVTLCITRYLDIPNILYIALMLSAVSFELWGVVLFATSPKMKNSKLRHWKLRLIGKEPK